MDWLSQNWLWVALAVAAAFYFFRGGLGGHAAGHGGMIGMGHGGHDDAPEAPSAAGSAEAVVDPISGEAVRTGQALTSVYQGKIYYFGSRENRDRFEAAPQQHAHKVSGQPLAAAPEQRPRRRHGCC